MKLIYCQACGDIVRLFPEKRYCRCGKSWGYYADQKNVVQSNNSFSVGIANQDFTSALDRLVKNPNRFSINITMRAWFNPFSESDVRYVRPSNDVDQI